MEYKMYEEHVLIDSHVSIDDRNIQQSCAVCGKSSHSFSYATKDENGATVPDIEKIFKDTCIRPLCIKTCDEDLAMFLINKGIYALSNVRIEQIIKSESGEGGFPYTNSSSKFWYWLTYLTTKEEQNQ